MVSLLGIPRVQLGLVATSKGLVAGNLQFEQEGVLVNCAIKQVGATVSFQTLRISTNIFPTSSLPPIRISNCSV